MHESKTSDQTKQKQLLPSPEPSSNDIATSTASEDEVPSSYMIPHFEQIGLNKGKSPHAIPNMTGSYKPKILSGLMGDGDDTIRLSPRREDSVLSGSSTLETNSPSSTKNHEEEQSSHLRQLDEYGIKLEQRIKFDGERFGYIFAKSLRPVNLTVRDIICHLPSLTYYALSLPHYMYFSSREST